MATRTPLGTNSNSAAVTSLAVAISAAVNTGDMIVGAIVLQKASSALSISDGTNAYVIEVTQVGATQQTLYFFRVLNATAIALNTNITCSWTGAGICSMWVSKINVSTTFDKSASATGNSTAPASGNTATTTSANEWWWGAISAGGGTLSAPGGGFTIGQTVSGGSIFSIGELYQEVAATGVANCSATNSSTQEWSAIVATYAESGGAVASKRIPNVPTIPTIPTVGTPI